MRSTRLLILSRMVDALEKKEEVEKEAIEVLDDYYGALRTIIAAGVVCCVKRGGIPMFLNTKTGEEICGLDILEKGGNAISMENMLGFAHTTFDKISDEDRETIVEDIREFLRRESVCESTSSLN